jgi:serine/threonine protein kinase
VPTCDSQNALLKEVGILAKLSLHPNLVRFCGVCLDPPLVVMDYCRNGSMFHMLEGARSAIMQGRPSKVWAATAVCLQAVQCKLSANSMTNTHTFQISLPVQQPSVTSLML